MAPPIRISPILCFCSLLVIVLSEARHVPLPLRNLPDPNVHDLLTEYGVPMGLLPNNVKSYTLSGNDSFRVELENPCYVPFTLLVYYDKQITGKLTYGSLSDLSGIQKWVHFIWIPVTEIKVNDESRTDNTLVFTFGMLSKVLPASLFDGVPTCKRQSHVEGKGIHPQAM